jgi:hypothetical protein
LLLSWGSFMPLSVWGSCTAEGHLDKSLFMIPLLRRESGIQAVIQSWTMRFRTSEVDI